MPEEDKNILKNNHGEKLLKAALTIYIDTECFTTKNAFMPNSENSCTERKSKHEPSGWAMVMECSLDATKNKYDHYGERDYIKEFCKKFKDNAMELINYKEKETMPLTDGENKFL